MKAYRLTLTEISKGLLQVLSNQKQIQLLKIRMRRSQVFNLFLAVHIILLSIIVSIFVPTKIKVEPTEKMSLKEKILESEIGNYLKYGEVPGFLYIHLILIMVLTFYILNNRVNFRVLKYHLDTIYNINEIDVGQNHILNDIGDLKDHIGDSIKSIYSLKTQVLNEFTYLDLPELSLNFHLFHQYLEKPLIIPINDAERSPIDKMTNDEIRALLKDVLDVFIELNYKVTFEVTEDYSICRQFALKYIYDFVRRGYIIFGLQIELTTCGISKAYESGNLNDGNLLFTAMILILGVIELVISIRKIYFSFKVVHQFKYNLLKEGKFQEWEMFSFSEKLRLFSKWDFLFAVNSISLIFSKKLSLNPFNSIR